MEIVPLRAEHCLALSDFAPAHRTLKMTPEMAVDLEDVGGFAVLDGDVLAIGGIFQQWRGVGLAWAWLSRSWRRHARAITAAAEAHLSASDLVRIETAVRCDYAAGHRWARRLGFTLETPCARKWGPDGSDYSIYVRVR